MGRESPTHLERMLSRKKPRQEIYELLAIGVSNFDDLRHVCLYILIRLVGDCRQISDV